MLAHRSKPLPKKLLRYTDVPSLIYILEHEKLTLLDPASWDDKNDAFYMEQYKDKKHLNVLRALCFTRASETYHHWRVFAPGSSGVCITFDKKMLINEIDTKQGFRHGAVEYKKIQDIQKLPPARINDLPFLKRYPFRDENEYRIIYEGKRREQEPPSFNFDLKSISRITLSPWLPESLSEPLKKTIKTLSLAPHTKVYRRTLTENELWKKVVENME